MTKTERKPNFLLAGAVKAGTTSIYNYLREHPEVYMPSVKEPRYFASGPIGELNDAAPRTDFFKQTSISRYADYLALFEPAGEEKTIGEASPQYLYYHHRVIPAIKARLGDVKIIIVLRNPVDRAFSAYQHLVRDRFETLSFREALLAEEERRSDGWPPTFFYFDAGAYTRQVRAYLECFTSVKIMLYDDLCRDPVAFTRQLYAFLGVDEAFLPNVQARYNMSGVPKNTFLYNFLHRDSLLRRMLKPLARRCLPAGRIAVYRTRLTRKNLSFLPRDNALHAELRKRFADDVLHLQDLIGRDLSAWLQ